MALPNPLPDDPRKWDGWRQFNSANLYERLCFSLEENPSDTQIEDACRQLLIWWQKKLPLKNQPSNPISQLVWSGLDAAPGMLTQARAELLKPEVRQRLDAEIRQRRREAALKEFQRFLDFALTDLKLTRESEINLRKLGAEKGLSGPDMDGTINMTLMRTGAVRVEDLPPPPPPPPPPTPPPVEPIPAATKAETRRVRSNRVNLARGPEDEFRRMLRLSGLDSDSMTDDQRDAFINVAENLGIDPGVAEDMVDEYLDEMEAKAAPPPRPAAAAGGRPAPYQPYRPGGAAPAGRSNTPASTPIPRPGAGTTVPGSSAAPVTLLTPDEERAKYLNFSSSTLQLPFVLIPSGSFIMGSDGPGAQANEQPIGRVNLTRYYISRTLVTNAQYEQFDPAHKAKRLAKSGDNHPVVYVSSLEAIKFCQWLSTKERKRYRLPTEAEWEYAARGNDGRTYPWGEHVGRGDLANFADANTGFPWSDKTVNDGYAETSPVGAFPRGASSFGVEDLAGNVWEWCSDFFEPYKGTERSNPTGPKSGAQRVLRGGSWKSRFNSLRAAGRNFNQPAFAANDVGFRLVCEAE